MSDSLTALDATFLELEQQDEGALMSIGGVMVFDSAPAGGAPTVEELCANLGPRLGQLPPLFAATLGVPNGRIRLAPLGRRRPFPHS